MHLCDTCFSFFLFVSSLLLKASAPTLLQSIAVKFFILAIIEVNLAPPPWLFKNKGCKFFMVRV